MPVLPALLVPLALVPPDATPAPKPAPVVLVVRAAPRSAAAPARIVFTAEVKGGVDDELRCLTFHWRWGDGTGSTFDECPDAAGGSGAGSSASSRPTTSTRRRGGRR
jgi:hypothetical protein